MSLNKESRNTWRDDTWLNTSKLRFLHEYEERVWSRSCETNGFLRSATSTQISSMNAVTRCTSICSLPFARLYS
eukprot:6214539-Pleurochrysis_carterae.AAC.7